MRAVFLLLAVQLFAVCHASCTKKLKDKIFVDLPHDHTESEEIISTQKKEIQRMELNAAETEKRLNKNVADLKLANEHLEDDIDYWKKENDDLTSIFSNELDAERIRIENLERENNILRGGFSDLKLQNEEKNSNLTHDLKESKEKILIQEKVISRIKSSAAKMEVRLKKDVADLKITNEHLRDDNDYLKKQYDDLMLVYQNELDAEIIRYENLEKESKILNEKSSELELQNEEKNSYLTNDLKESKEIILTQEKEMQKMKSNAAEMEERLKRNYVDLKSISELMIIEKKKNILEEKLLEVELRNEYKNSYLTQENEMQRMQSNLQDELDAERIRFENLEKENNILREKSSELDLQNEEKNQLPKIRDHYLCGICCDDFRDSDVFACLADKNCRVVCEQCHVFHAECLEKFQSYVMPGCPICRTKYTKIAKFPNPFTVNKQDPESFEKLFKGLFDNNERISRMKSITAISPFVTVLKGRDCNDEIDKIMPSRKEFKISEFQEFTAFLMQICKQDGHNLYFDKNLSELQIDNVIKYFQKEMEKEIRSISEYRMIVETLQKEEEHKLDATAIGFWINAAYALREFLIYLSLASMVFVYPIVLDAVLSTNIEAYLEKIGFYKGIVCTTGFAFIMMLYSAIGRPVIRFIWRLYFQIMKFPAWIIVQIVQSN